MGTRLMQKCKGGEGVGFTMGARRNMRSLFTGIGGGVTPGGQGLGRGQEEVGMWLLRRLLRRRGRFIGTRWALSCIYFGVDVEQQGSAMGVGWEILTG